VFIPIGDYPNPRGVPWMTVLLLTSNVAVFILITLPLSATPVSLHDPRLPDYLDLVARVLPGGSSLEALVRQTTAYDLLVFEYGFRADRASLITLFTSMFLHGGFLHLAGNMLFLWIYGDNVEHRLGAVAFLFWYLVTGVAATLTHALIAPGPPLPLVGASGAISGVLGFYFLLFPGHFVRVLLLLFPFYVGTVMIPARIVLGLYLVVDNLLPLILAPTGPVAHGAHIGGFVAGLAVAAWLRFGRK
jgi:membrane associated rhomboid family serine protease